MDNNLDNVELKHKNNGGKLIVCIVAIILISAISFVCYDKFINKEKPPVPTPTPTAIPNNDNLPLTSIDNYVLTAENQNIKVGNNNLAIRINNDIGAGIYINDELVFDKYGADHIYVTNKFAFFTLNGQFDSLVSYAIDLNGKEIKVNNDSHYYIHDIHLDNGEIVGMGMDALKSLEDNTVKEEELVIKYENNSVTITTRN